MKQIIGPEQLTTGQIARILRVNPRTVARWADAKKITATLTPGGHRRFSRAQVEALMTGGTR